MRGAVFSCFLALLLSSGTCSWLGADETRTSNLLSRELPGIQSYLHQVVRKNVPDYSQSGKHSGINLDFFRRFWHRTFFFDESIVIGNHRADMPIYDFANYTPVVLANSLPWIFQAKNGVSAGQKNSVQQSTGEVSGTGGGEQESGQGDNTSPGQSGGASGGGASGGDDGKKPPSDQKTTDKQLAETEESEAAVFWDLLITALAESEFEALFCWLEEHPDFVDTLDDTAVQNIHSTLWDEQVPERIIRRLPERLRPPVIFAPHLCINMEQINEVCNSYDFFHTSTLSASAESLQTDFENKNRDEDDLSATSSAGSSETSVSSATGQSRPKTKGERKKEKQSGYYDLVASPCEKPESETDREKREAMEAEEKAKKEEKREKQKRRQQEIKLKKQQEKAEKRRQQTESDASLNTGSEINPDDPFIELLSSPAVADADVATQGACAVVSQQNSQLRRKKSGKRPLQQPHSEEVQRIATTVVELVMKGKTPKVEITKDGNLQLEVEFTNIEYQSLRMEASQGLQFNDEQVELSTIEEFSDFLLHQDINADQLWAIIRHAVSASLQNQQLPNGLLWLLWKAARGNLKALYALVEAHAQQLANRPDRLLRTIRRYWLVSSGSLTQPEPCSFSEAQWTQHLSSLLSSSLKRDDTRPSPGLNHKTRKLVVEAWKAYINKKHQLASEKIQTLKKNGQGAAISLLEREIHPGNGEETENLSESEQRHSRWLLPHDRLGSFIPHSVYTDIAVQLVGLAKREFWDIFLRLYNAMLASLSSQNPGVSALEDILDILARDIDTTILHGLIGSLTQHSETAGAATILIRAVMEGHLTEVACSQCNQTHFNTQRLVCTQCNPDPFYLCQSCFSSLPQVTEGTCCVTENCPGVFSHSQDTELMSLLAQQVNQCPLPILEEVVIEVPFLVAAGHSELALALLDADFSLGGILPDNPATHASVLRFLLIEFFDQPESLQTILQLIRGNVGLNWLEQLIKVILEKMQTVREVQGCSASFPGNSEKSS